MYCDEILDSVVGYALSDSNKYLREKAPDLMESNFIKLRGPRRIGHTTAIIEVSKKRFKNPVVFFANPRLLRNFQDKVKSENQVNYLLLNALSTKELAFPDQTDVVFVDNASFTSDGALSKIESAYLDLVKRTNRRDILLIHLQ